MSNIGKDANNTPVVKGALARVRLSFMANYNLTKANRHGTITAMVGGTAGLYSMDVNGRTIYVTSQEFRLDPKPDTNVAANVAISMKDADNHVVKEGSSARIRLSYLKTFNLLEAERNGVVTHITHLGEAVLTLPKASRSIVCNSIQFRRN